MQSQDLLYVFHTRFRRREEHVAKLQTPEVLAAAADDAGQVVTVNTPPLLPDRVATGDTIQLVTGDGELLQVWQPGLRPTAVASHPAP